METVTDLQSQELAKQALQDSEIISQAVIENRLRIITAKYQMSSGGSTNPYVRFPGIEVIN